MTGKRITSPGTRLQWVGKAVGSLLGFAAAGPIGSLLGLVLGHRFDEGFSFAGKNGAPGPVPRELSGFFFQTTFELMGRVAKIDGRVSEEEIRVARRIMHTMQLTPEQVTSAIEYFTAGKRADFPVAERLAELGRQLEGRPDLGRAFVEIQMQAAIAAGSVELAKRRLLWRIASALGVGRVELAQIEALIRAHQRLKSEHGEALDLEGAYKVLGVSAGASDVDVKRAYRRLMNQHHPDKLLSRGMPQTMVALAEQKTHEIRAAYDRIKTHRAFK
jgi:DnaJ like chaperone protein